MTAANTPGLQPEIADPMRTWSVDATKLLVKMGLRIPGDSLNTTANRDERRRHEGTRGMRSRRHPRLTALACAVGVGFSLLTWMCDGTRRRRTARSRCRNRR